MGAETDTTLLARHAWVGDMKTKLNLTDPHIREAKADGSIVFDKVGGKHELSKLENLMNALISFHGFKAETFPRTHLATRKVAYAEIDGSIHYMAIEIPDRLRY